MFDVNNGSTAKVIKKHSSQVKIQSENTCLGNPYMQILATSGDFQTAKYAKKNKNIYLN